MKTDWNDLVRKSMRKDFAKANFKHNGRTPRTPHPKNTKRVMAIHERCEYYRFRKYFIGKLVRRIGIPKDNGATWVEFVNENDRAQLNHAAGWSREKRMYLLYNAKFDD